MGEWLGEVELEEGASFSRAPDERAARSSPAGRSGKAIALAVHCPANDSFFFFSFLSFCKRRGE